jgi:hypothetical protein
VCAATVSCAQALEANERQRCLPQDNIILPDLKLCRISLSEYIGEMVPLMNLYIGEMIPLTNLSRRSPIQLRSHCAGYSDLRLRPILSNIMLQKWVVASRYIPLTNLSRRSPIHLRSNCAGYSDLRLCPILSNIMLQKWVVASRSAYLIDHPPPLLLFCFAPCT